MGRDLIHVMPTPILFILPYLCSLWSLQALKTLLISVVFVVPFDFYA